MKKSFLRLFLFSLSSLAVIILGASCTSAKKVSSGDKALSGNFSQKDSAAKDDLVFELGNDVSKWFTGTVYLNNLIKKNSTYNFPTSNTVTFAPGSRSAWHTHGGMVLVVVGGKGLYQEEGKKAQVIRKGDVLQIPAGVRHWHGAASDSWFQQICIYDDEWKDPNPSSQSATISDEDYKNLETEDYAGRKITAEDKFMFGDGKLYNFNTFSGEVGLSQILDYPNEAGAPGLLNVVFEKGVYNNWHSHAGGQILIVTDGTGYHQLAGGNLEILHAGDVAFCPPDVTHWHGATASSSFAHLAASTNPGNDRVEWGGRILEEEYKNLPQE